MINKTAMTAILPDTNISFYNYPTHTKHIKSINKEQVYLNFF